MQVCPLSCLECTGKPHMYEPAPHVVIAFTAYIFNLVCLTPLATSVQIAPSYGFHVFLKRCNCILTVMMPYPVAGKNLPQREQHRGVKSCVVLQACAQSSFVYGTRPSAASFAPPGNSAHARSHLRRRDALPGRNVSHPLFIALVRRVSRDPRVHVVLPRIILMFNLIND